MANSYTTHSRDLRARTATAYNEALVAAGWRKVTTILPPHTAKELDELVRSYGTIKAALIASIHFMSERPHACSKNS